MRKNKKGTFSFLQEQKNLQILLLLVVILIAGALLTSWTISRAERIMRGELIRQARLIGQTIDAERIKSFTGSDKDYADPDFLRLKEQLIQVKTIRDKFKYIYIIKKNQDGEISFIIDSKENNAPDHPATETYQKLFPEYSQFFQKPGEVVTGPVSIGTEKIITTLIPLYDFRANQLIAVLGIEITANKWTNTIYRPAIIPLAFTLILIIILFISSYLFSKRKKISKNRIVWLQYLETAIVIITGIVISIYATIIIHQREVRSLSEIFHHLAVSKTDAIRESLNDIAYFELEGLGRFFEGSEYVDNLEFIQYTSFLNINPSVQAWQWIRPVSKNEKNQLEAYAKSEIYNDFEIWHIDANGNRVRSDERQKYYPILYITPVKNNETAFGYDIGSEPVRYTSMEEAITTGLTTCSYPINPVEGENDQKTLSIFRPVFDSKMPNELTGLVSAIINVNEILQSAIPDETILFEISIGTSSIYPELLAFTGYGPSQHGFNLSFFRPVFYFSKTFFITSQASQAFIDKYYTKDGWIALILGLIFTASLSFITELLRRREAQLRRLVAIRTSKLYETTEHLAATLRSIGDGVITCDTSGKILSLNIVAETLTGWRSDEAENLPLNKVLKMINARTRKPVEDPINRVLLTGKVIGLGNHTILISKNGHEYQIADSCAPIFNTDGGITGIVLVFRDVTQEYKYKEELRESEERYKSIISVSKTGVWEYQRDPDNLWCSPEYFTMLGYELEEFKKNNRLNINNAWIDLLHPDDKKKATQLFITYLTNGSVGIYENYFRMKHSNGRWLWIWSRGQTLRKKDGSLSNLTVGTHIDITQRIQYEEEIIKAKNKAEESDRLKMAFLQNMSHEIRTPMNAIIGFSSMLNSSELPEEKKANFATIIESSSKQLLSIVNDILTMSSIETNQEKVNIEKTNINEVLKTLHEIFIREATIKKLKFTVNTELDNNKAEIYSDKTKIAQILTNLLTNAFKFTEKGEISLGYQLIGNLIEFYVKDTGIGIQPEVQGIIFERFRQADMSISKQYSGTGLGLSISKGFVDLLGGSIRVESGPEKGSAFYFSVPYNPVGETSEPKPVEKILKSKNATILIAEDEENNSQYLQELLKMMGLQYICAKDGQETVDTCKTNAQIDIILMDIKMPVMDGYKAAEAIKNFRPETVIIAQSAYALEHEIDGYGKIFDDYITKPINQKKLQQILMKYIK